MSVEQEILNLNRELYPTGRVWNFATDTLGAAITTENYVDGLDNQFVDGLDNPFVSEIGVPQTGGKKSIAAELKSFVRLYEDALSILNTTLADNDNFSETDATNWERVLALMNSSLTLTERKQAINRKLAYPNGIAERANYIFIQDQLQSAGFDVYVYENRISFGS